VVFHPVRTRSENPVMGENAAVEKLDRSVCDLQEDRGLAAFSHEGQAE
jgi:hypothetical protein